MLAITNGVKLKTVGGGLFLTILPKKGPKTPMIKVNFRIPVTLNDEMKAVGEETGYSPSEVMRALVTAGLGVYRAERKANKK